MGFLVLPALVTDISAVYDVYFSAFKENAVTRALFPSATPEDMSNAASDFRKGHTAHVQQYWSTDSTQYTLKCVDTDTGKIVGMALWDIYLTPSKWRRSELFWLSGQERERADALIQPLWNAREMLWLDERYLYCHILAVHPEYQRRGIGELLMQFGIDVAQKAVLPIYVESSREGVRLYEKMGCRRIKTPAGIRSDIPKPEGTAKVKEDSDVALFVWTSDAGLELLPKTIEIV